MVLKIFICNKLLLLLLLSLEKEGKEAAAACFENNIDKKRLPAAAALVAVVVVVVVTSACGVLVVSIPLSVCFRVHFYHCGSAATVVQSHSDNQSPI